MATKIIQDSISVGAGATNTNVLSGKTFERVPADSQQVFMTLKDSGSATGLQRAFNVGGSIEVERGLVSATNRVPQLKDTVGEDVEGFGGDLLQLSVENTTAGALTYFYSLAIEGA